MKVTKYFSDCPLEEMKAKFIALFRIYYLTRLKH